MRRSTQRFQALLSCAFGVAIHIMTEPIQKVEKVPSQVSFGVPQRSHHAGRFVSGFLSDAPSERLLYYDRADFKSSKSDS